MLRGRSTPLVFVRDITAAKTIGEGSFPVYSRDKSDPVSDGVVLTRERKIILCEGNYLLAFDDDD